jgi:histidinol-phosphate aminotransferase
MPLPYPLNPSLEKLPVYQPGRPIEEVARELNLPADSIIKLASNENPLGPSRLALAAMKKALTHAHLYPDGNAFYLKQKLAANLGLTPNHLILGNGSNEIIEFLGHALLSPFSSLSSPQAGEGQGEEAQSVPAQIPSPQPSPRSGGARESVAEVVVSQYCFAVYPIVTALFGAKLVVVPAKKYGHDLDAMLAAITPATRIVFVANPNNPTGTVVSPEALQKFISAVPPHVVIALDEAYIEFLEIKLDLLPAIAAGTYPNLILMRTFSKIYGLAGLRIGYGIGHPELIAALEKVRQPFNINAISQAGALAALDDAKHVAKTQRINRRGLGFFKRACKQMQLEFVPSAANFILIKVGDGARVFAEMQKRGVITRPMAGYQLGEWIRISIGTPKESERCLEALRQALGR